MGLVSLLGRMAVGCSILVAVTAITYTVYVFYWSAVNSGYAPVEVLGVVSLLLAVMYVIGPWFEEVLV